MAVAELTTYDIVHTKFEIHKTRLTSFFVLNFSCRLQKKKKRKTLSEL